MFAISEKADIETSSENYAKRFSGKIGEYFLNVQTKITLTLLKPLPKAKILDVGGGHAQIAVPLVKAGLNLTVVGSDDSCEERLNKFLDKKSYTYLTCNLLNLPFEKNSFDAVTCFRLLTHETNWKIQISELCRVARSFIIIDYPDIRSFNIFYKFLFGFKKKIEGNTRTFRNFSRKELIEEIKKNGFYKPVFKPEFFMPMVVHRAVKNVMVLKAMESSFYILGLTKLFGSPVIARFESKNIEA
jgi:2-polyprenyl-3-methyl-5-hydroxy-6-metoxy-1,4-benzoquinol methylase